MSEGERRRNNAQGDFFRQPLAALLFGRASPGQYAGNSLAGKVSAQCDPVGFGPELVVAAGGVQQDDEGCCRQPGQGKGWRRNAIVHRIIRGVAEGAAGQQAIAHHRVLVFFDPQRFVIEQRSQRFAGALPVEAAVGALGKAGNDRAFDQPLGVEHYVISLAAQVFDESRYLGVHGAAEQVLAPASHGDGNDFPHARMQGRNAGEGFFHHPVDFGFREMGANVADDGQVVDDIPHRGGFDEQYLRHRGILA